MKTYVAFANWSCDSCGRTEMCSAHTHPPGWRALLLAPLGEAEIDSTLLPRLHLCPRCDTYLTIGGRLRNLYSLGCDAERAPERGSNDGDGGRHWRKE